MLDVKKNRYSHSPSPSPDTLNLSRKRNKYHTNFEASTKASSSKFAPAASFKDSVAMSTLSANCGITAKWDQVIKSSKKQYASSPNYNKYNPELPT